MFSRQNITGAKIIYNKLLQHNVKDVFLYTGGAIMPLIDTFYNNKINYYINTHEQSSGHAATSYARVTGRPGISIVTSGPGVTNSVTALTDATNDSTPFILFSGNVSLDTIGTNAFQECPAVDITRPITKWSYMVKDVKELEDVVDEAFYISTNGKPGAVHIDLPKCILSCQLGEQGEQGELGEPGKPMQNKTSIFNNKTNIFNKLSIKKLVRVSNLINNAKKPVILAGQGCNNYSDELRRFAILNKIPVTTTIHAMGLFDETHNLSLDFLGMHGNVAANYSIQEADLIIALGTRFDDRITGSIKKYAPNAFKAYKDGNGGIVHVNNNTEEIGNIINTHYNFHADCGVFLRALISENSINNTNNTDTLNYINRLAKRESWLKQISNWKDKYPFDYSKTEQLKTQEVICELNRHLSLRNDDYIITTGVGNHQMMAAQFIKWRYPKSFITSGSLGVMGVGLPFAIGCQIAHPEKMIIDIDGDGSFNHTLSELKTVANYDLPVKIAIMNDGHFSMVKTWEKLFYKRRYTATDLCKNPDYVKLAESYGIRGISCSKREDLHDKISDFLSYDKAILCDFRVVPDECYPFVAPNAGLDEIMMCDKNDYIKYRF